MPAATCANSACGVRGVYGVREACDDTEGASKDAPRSPPSPPEEVSPDPTAAPNSTTTTAAVEVIDLGEGSTEEADSAARIIAALLEEGKTDRRPTEEEEREAMKDEELARKMDEEWGEVVESVDFDYGFYMTTYPTRRCWRRSKGSMAKS